MVRDTTEGKTDYSLVFDGPMFKRWALHLTKGAVKYAKRNWMQANGQAELDRFRESALRHFIQWYDGDRDEDHASAVFFNVNGAEYVKARRDYRPSGEELVAAIHLVADHAFESEQEIADAIYERRVGDAH